MAKSKQICERFFAEFDLSQIRFLHLFLAIQRNKEIETGLIATHLWLNFYGVKIVVPKVNLETDTLETVELNSDSKFALNAWQIPEPIANKFIDAQLIDVVLVPLLCVDERGFRVGYGKGFYDKFLPNCRADCVKIGLSYFPPIPEIVDTNEFDVKLDYCLTPKRNWKF